MRYVELSNYVTGETITIDVKVSRYRKLAYGFLNKLRLKKYFVKHIILTQSTEQYQPKHINSFMRAMSKRYKDMCYIWTIEVQEERREKYGDVVLHWHLLCGFPYSHKFNREDIKKIQSYWHFGNDKNSVEIRPVWSVSLNYLMKYIGKALDSPLESVYKIRRIGSSRLEGFLRQSVHKLKRCLDFFKNVGQGWEDLSLYYWSNGNAFLWDHWSIGGYTGKNKMWVYRKPRSEWFVRLRPFLSPF